MEPTQFIESNYTFTKESKYTPIGSNARIIQGMDRPGLYQLFAKLGYKVGCEVGLEQGRNTLEMCNNIPGLAIYGVDPYKQHPQASYVYDAELRHWDERYLNKMKAKAEKDKSNNENQKGCDVLVNPILVFLGFIAHLLSVSCNIN